MKMLNPTLVASAELVTNNAAVLVDTTIVIDVATISGASHAHGCGYAMTDVLSGKGRTNATTGTWAYASSSVKPSFENPAFEITTFTATDHSQRKRLT